MKEITKNNIILVVTDRDDLYCSVHSSLGDNFTFMRSFTVIDALSNLAFQVPSIIIADTDLPDANGYELLKKVRNSIKTRLIPFIFITRKDHSGDRIEALETGADAVLVYPFIEDELRAIVNSRLDNYREFYLLSITDELTRLYNRRELIKRFNEEISSTENSVVSLSILDIDYFKKINDIYGHQVGDMVLMRLARILKERTSDSFIPARFGGEEFVIIFPGIPVKSAHSIMEDILSEFSSIVFEKDPDVFRVTFSAGLSEFPSMSSNISELLSRADQALYSAKNDGRNLIYTFSPIMARNDKFWEYLKLPLGLYVDSATNDAITGLPYLPRLLEIISTLQEPVKSIGCLIIKPELLYSIDELLGVINWRYNIESMKMLIEKSSESIFPFDTYTGLIDFFNHEFILLYPSVPEFTINRKRFSEICDEICTDIKNNLDNFSFDLSYSSTVLTLDSQNPRKIVRDIHRANSRKKSLTSKKKELVASLKIFRDLEISEAAEKLLRPAFYYNLDSITPAYQYLALKGGFRNSDMFNVFFENSIADSRKCESFLNLAGNLTAGETGCPLILPWNRNIPLDSYLDIVSRAIPGRDVIVCINEYSMSGEPDAFDHSILNNIPGSISIGLDNCYIGGDILNLLSMYNFSFLLFSEHITSTLYLFRDRIKIISGLKIFLDQINVQAVTKNISTAEEYQIIRDLGIHFSSGPYIEDILS